MIFLSDFKKADGDYDFEAYRAAEIQAGQRCTLCGAFIVFAKGHPSQCGDCERIQGDTGEVTHASRIRCPACGWLWSPFDDGDEEMSDGEHDVQCPHCDENFEVTTHISFSFSSPARKQEE